VTLLTNTPLTSLQVEEIIRSAAAGCRSDVELRAYYKSIIELNRLRSTPVRSSPRYRDRDNLKLLMISGMTPGIGHGGGLRLFDIINELPESYSVDLYCKYKQSSDLNSLDQLRSRLSSVQTVRKLKPEKILRWLSTENKLNGYYDVIQFEYPSTVELISRLSGHTRRTGYTFMEARTRSLAMDLVREYGNKSDGYFFAQCREFVGSLCLDAKAMRDADFTIAVTKEDAEFCGAIGGTTPEVAPHAVSSVILKDARETRNPERFDECPKAAVFVGYYGHTPNVDALEWYLEYVHAEVCKRVPGYRIYIVGGGDTSAQRKRTRNDLSIVFSGWVERLGPWIAKGSICISPLISGAGLRGKINQYSVYKRPTVSTSIGVSGTNYVHRESVLIADDPAEFANSMVELMQDGALWSRICQGGQEVASTWTWPRMIKNVRRIYENWDPAQCTR
jgi:glycosyltransferase involved in cell wall biosynthesis